MQKPEHFEILKKLFPLQRGLLFQEFALSEIVDFEYILEQNSLNYQKNRFGWLQDDHFDYQVASKVGQDGSKMVPGWLKLPPRWPKMPPRWPQMAPRWVKKLPRWLKMAPRWSKKAPRWPKLAQVGSKLAARCP